MIISLNLQSPHAFNYTNKIMSALFVIYFSNYCCIPPLLLFFFLAAVFKGRPRKKYKKGKCQNKKSESVPAALKVCFDRFEIAEKLIICFHQDFSPSSRRVSARQKTKKRTHYDNFALIDEYKPKRQNRKRANSNKTAIATTDNSFETSPTNGDESVNSVCYSPSSADTSPDSAKKRKRKSDGGDQYNKNTKRKDLKLTLMTHHNSSSFARSKDSMSSSGSITPASENGEKSSSPSSPFSYASSPQDSGSEQVDLKNIGAPDEAMLKMLPASKEDFLVKLYSHMQGNKTPINKIPSLGFKRRKLLFI